MKGPVLTETTLSLIAAIPMPVLVIGQDERIRATNPALDAILGRDLTGKHHITALRQPGVIDAIARVRGSGGAASVRFVSRDRDKDTPYLVHITAASNDIVLCLEDQSAAEDVGKMRRDFVANVSHELRTPLTALLGFIETLGGAARDDATARARFLGIMAHEAERMTRLVDDLLSLSRVEEDERVRPRELVDLCGLLASVINGAGTAGRRRRCHSPAGPCARCDARAKRCGAIDAGLCQPDREWHQIWRLWQGTGHHAA